MRISKFNIALIIFIYFILIVFITHYLIETDYFHLENYKIIAEENFDVKIKFKISEIRNLRKSFDNSDNQTLIIVITPTYYRFTQLADMTRMANTLMHVPKLHWIVIEDGKTTNKNIKKLLKRSRIPFSYLPFRTQPGYPKRGWYQRTMALKLLRKNNWNNTNAVVYFEDDDNSYDIRLFTDYIRNVRKLGMWAVGYAGGAIAESLIVVNGKVTGFDVVLEKSRKFAVDMAGFAIHLEIVLKNNATFGKFCGSKCPETCILEEMHFTKNDIEPFGFEKSVCENV